MVDMTGNILDIRVDNTIQSLGNINSNSNTQQYHVRDITQMLIGLEMMYCLEFILKGHPNEYSRDL